MRVSIRQGRSWVDGALLRSKRIKNKKFVLSSDLELSNCRQTCSSSQRLNCKVPSLMRTFLDQSGLPRLLLLNFPSPSFLSICSSRVIWSGVLVVSHLCLRSPTSWPLRLLQWVPNVCILQLTDNRTPALHHELKHPNRHMKPKASCLH